MELHQRAFFYDHTGTGDNYSGEPMAYLFEDSEIEETIAPYIMARIVDVENFLAGVSLADPAGGFQNPFPGY